MIKKFIRQFCWIFKIGWTRPIIWVGDNQIEYTYFNKKRREIRRIKTFLRPPTAYDLQQMLMLDEQLKNDEI